MALHPTMKLELDIFALTLNPIFTVKVVEMNAEVGGNKGNLSSKR